MIKNLDNLYKVINLNFSTINIKKKGKRRRRRVIVPTVITKDICVIFNDFQTISKDIRDYFW